MRKFRVGPDAGAAHAAATGTERYAAHYIPTPWPPPGAAFSFQAAATALYRRLERTAASCCALLESAFDSAGVSPLPPSHTSILSVNLCRMNDDELRRRREQGAASIHEHTDVSLFTLVLVQPAIDCQGGARRGLEVCRPSDGVWAAVSPPANSLVLLVGDLLEFWSRGAVKASLHRVALPLSSEESREFRLLRFAGARHAGRRRRARRAAAASSAHTPRDRGVQDGRRVADRGGGRARVASSSTSSAALKAALDFVFTRAPWPVRVRGRGGGYACVRLQRGGGGRLRRADGDWLRRAGGGLWRALSVVLCTAL